MSDKLILCHPLHTRWTSVSMYPTLPTGVEFKVALPNMPNPVDTYDTSPLFVTRGAQEYFILSMRNEQPTVTMQHCALQAPRPRRELHLRSGCGVHG